MPELTQQERLQPSLLDRLTDEEPGNPHESRDHRVLSLARLRESVRRDLSWLLNTGNLGSTLDLTPYPTVAHSVLNYGIPELAGTTSSNADPASLERLIRQSIVDFEPRILSETVRVRTVAAEAATTHNALTFVIEGELWSRPLPLELYLKTEIDLEGGTVRVSDVGGSGRP